MFSKKDFQDWAKGGNAIVFAAVMTKIDGRENDGLLRDYGFRGFPSLAILDSTGKAITKKVDRSLESMSTVTKASKRYVTMKAKVDAGEDYNKGAWFMTRLKMGQIEVAAAKEEMGNLQLREKQTTRANNMIFAMELEGMLNKQRAQMRRPRGRGQAQDAAAPRGEKLDIEGFVYKSFQSGKRIPKGHGILGFFDSHLIEAGKKNSDAKAFLFSYERVRKTIAARIAQYKNLVKRYENQDSDRAQMMMQRLEQITTRFETQLSELDAQAKKFKSN